MLATYATYLLPGIASNRIESTMASHPNQAIRAPTAAAS